MRDARTRSLTIGRDPDCDIALDEDSVSAHHAEVMLSRAGRLFVTDCASSNGTHIDEQGCLRRVGQELVVDADAVLFGECRMSIPELGEEVRRLAGGAADSAGGRTYERCICGRVRVRGRPCTLCNGNSTPARGGHRDR